MRPVHTVLVAVLLAAVLGATVLREELAAAAPPGIADVFVTNDVRTPVPVKHVGADPGLCRRGHDRPLEADLTGPMGGFGQEKVLRGSISGVLLDLP